jgi:hypothetical protein
VRKDEAYSLRLIKQDAAEKPLRWFLLRQCALFLRSGKISGTLRMITASFDIIDALKTHFLE